ncbi:MAG: hypothetical protein ABW128_16900 [Rhizorhabdus sp.]
MTDLFLLAARNKFRFPSRVGAITVEQLFDLQLTSATGKPSLNDTAISLADEIDRTGARSFVSSASGNPARTRLTQQLEIVKTIIKIREDEGAEARARLAKRAERDKLLEAIDAADRRELGSKSADELRAQLAALAD